MTQSLSLKAVPSPMRMLFRPILFAALGFHALLLFTPLPAEQRPKEPDDKKDPLKVTQLPTAVPQPIKPAAKVNVKVTAVKRSTVVPARPIVPPPAPPTTFTPAITSTPSASLPNVPSQPLPPSANNITDSLLAASRASTTDAAKALFELLAAMPVPDQFDPAAGSATRLDLIENPSLFFKASTEPDVVPEPLPGLESSPLFTPGEEPEIFFETYFSQSLQGIFEQISKVGEYGGGPLYKLQKGNSTTFLSLMPAKKGTVGAIVSVWSKDPRTK